MVVCFCLVGCNFSHGALHGGTSDGATGDDDASVVDTDAPRDAARDATPLDGPTPLCGGATPRINATFETAPACPLDNIGGTATLGLAQGTLQISTNTNNELAYCNEQNLGTWSGNGATVEVTSVMTGNNAWTSFQVLVINMAMTEKNGFLVFGDNTGANVYGTVAYTAALMRWWRIRPDSTGTNVIAEYSANRVVWTTLGSHAGGGMIRAQLVAGTDPTASPSGNSRYDNLVVCP